MKAIITTGEGNTRLFLNQDGMATDIPSRAAIFRDGADATIRAIEENGDIRWRGIKWAPAYMMHDGVIVLGPRKTDFTEP
jgi:hypothetical protein